MRINIFLDSGFDFDVSQEFAQAKKLSFEDERRFEHSKVIFLLSNSNSNK